ARRGRRYLGAARVGLVEARERLGFAVDVEYIGAGDGTIGSKDQELEGRYLPGPPPAAAGAEEREAAGDGARPGAGGAAEANGDIDKLEPGAPVLQVLVRSAPGPASQDPTVDDLDGRCQRLGEAIELDRAGHRRDRARRRRGTVACGPVGQQLGVALVQP